MKGSSESDNVIFLLFVQNTSYNVELEVELELLCITVIHSVLFWTFTMSSFALFWRAEYEYPLLLLQLLTAFHFRMKV